MLGSLCLARDMIPRQHTTVFFDKGWNLLTQNEASSGQHTTGQRSQCHRPYPCGRSILRSSSNISGRRFQRHRLPGVGKHRRRMARRRIGSSKKSNNAGRACADGWFQQSMVSVAAPHTYGSSICRSPIAGVPHVLTVAPSPNPPMQQIVPPVPAKHVADCSIHRRVFCLRNKTDHQFQQNSATLSANLAVGCNTGRLH